MPENDSTKDPPLDRPQSENASSEGQHTETQAAQEEKTDSDSATDLEAVQVDLRRAVLGGVLAAAVALVGGWLVGEASGAEARILLETSLSSTRSFAGTVTLALGNILALMLTLLSLSTSAEIDLKWSYYKRVDQVAWLVSIVLTASILIYLLLNIPLSEAEKAADSTNEFGYATLYYITLVLSSMMAGALITVVLMLYNTVQDIIHAVGLRETDHPLIYTEEDESN